MRALVALVRREYLEHRGPFLYAPWVIVAMLAVTVVGAYVTGRTRFDFGGGGPFGGGVPNLTKFFELAYAATAGMWWVYLLVALFFYFADAFNADRRNNAMLFWKSMPQSDFKLLMSKFVAAMTLFPVLVLLAAMATGVLAFPTALAGAGVVRGWALPGAAETLSAYAQVTLAAAVYFGLGLLWYAPFLAWVGGLSTLVGRWSIPLAFLIPGFFVLLENVLVGDLGPGGGYLYTFLAARSMYGLDGEALLDLFVQAGSFDALAFTGRLTASIDFVAMASGWLFAVIVVYLASEYRRRLVTSAA